MSRDHSRDALIPGELVERLEVAEAGSRELDAAIWCAVRGHTFHRLTDADRALIYVPARGKGMSREVNFACVTTSLDAALALAERVLGEKGALLILADLLNGESPSGLDLICVRDLPRLLCIAILKATTASAVGIAAGDEPKAPDAAEAVTDDHALRVGRAILDAHGQWEIENNRFGGQDMWGEEHVRLLGHAAMISTAEQEGRA